MKQLWANAVNKRQNNYGFQYTMFNIWESYQLVYYSSLYYHSEKVLRREEEIRSATKKDVQKLKLKGYKFKNLKLRLS